jgi:malate dehydrogenase (oxaloacetate-decarboxylating)
MPNCPVAPENLRGMNLINSPIWNKGTSFTPEEREAFALEGLLPPYVETLEEQCARAYSGIRPNTSDLQKHMYLRGLQDTNEVLFYRLLLDHPDELLPLVYKPAVVEGCRNFADIYRRPRGIFISYPLRDRIPELLRNRPYLEVDMIVVTDGEQILGLGDAGVSGLSVPIGKLSLYSLVGGIHPSRTLPIVLDVGTNNRALLNDPSYLGWRHERVDDREYFGFIDQFIQAIREELPGTCIQWEDLPEIKAQRILNLYQEVIPTFNDNLQGTAAVTVATLDAAFKATNWLLRAGEVVLFGTGPTAIKTADYFCRHLARDGVSAADACRRIWLVDEQGVLHEGRRDLTLEQSYYARPLAEISTWMRNGHLGLEALLKKIKASALVWLSDSSDSSPDEAVIRAMARQTPHPIILLLSPVANCSEARAEELIRWTEGRGVIAWSSMPASFNFKGRMVNIAQCDSIYVFPGVGLGLAASRAMRVTDDMILAAARALAARSPALEDLSKPLLPRLQDLREVAVELAAAAGLEAQNAGLAPRTSEAELLQEIRETQWRPEYPAMLIPTVAY